MTDEPCVHDRCVHTCADCGEVIGIESHDQAYQNGADDEREGWEEEVQARDSFIEQQAALITSMMHVLSAAKAWNLVPSDVYEELRNYV